MKQFCKYGHDTNIVGRSAQSVCKQCARDRARKCYLKDPSKWKARSYTWRAKNPERSREITTNWSRKNPDTRANRKLINRYGITLVEKQTMFDLQGGECAVCHKKLNTLSKACVDHNHKTMELRGLLCNHCNQAYGLLKEDENTIIGLLAYHRTSKNKEMAACLT